MVILKTEKETRMKKIVFAGLIAGLVLLSNPVFSPAQDGEVIKLPAPQTGGGKPLMEALMLRQSSRGDFGPAVNVTQQQLSNLLWAANGVNRPKGNFRTAPTAAGWNNIDIYVTTSDGLFIYDAAAHALKVVTKEDVRAKSGIEGPAAGFMRQDFAKTAPCSLIYVADMEKTGGMKWEGEEVGATWSYANAAAIAQNVYLYCASEGLACILRAMIDPAQIAKTFNLRPGQQAILTTTIGQFK
jgi:nitroreductase